MLKALELSGFKSFADDTRFDFPAGITVVVGPNGSGKSNIVDAIKWVLGAQSAKSLRGKEMADVIFKGSGSGQRKPANTAEATIIFENLDNIFGVDTEEVRVTRRVYRSGEGEYLINGQACRLRDIRDMFRGTGVGADAYSLIEQGKVDSLLEASAKDRRAIFEEAAGISRFKAKKIEAQRRLERVEQNLLRLSDIVDEVDHRLRRLKSQAGKARRYKEYSDRLQSLRTQVGQVDWQRLSNQLVGIESQIVGFQSQMAEGGTELQSMEALAFEIDTEGSTAEEELRDREAQASRVRERTAARESTVIAERKRLTDLDEELDRLRRQMQAMTSRAGDLQSQWKEASDEQATAQEDHDAKFKVVQQAQRDLQAASDELGQAREQREQQQAEHVQRMQAASELNQQIAMHQSAIDASSSLMSKTSARKEAVSEALEAAGRSAEERRSQLETFESQVSELDSKVGELRTKLTSAEEEYTKLNDEVIALRQRHAVVGERVALLEEIEQRMEGVGSGVKKLLKMQQEDPDGPLSAIRGMVADLVHVRDAKDAELVAIALGDQAQHLVIAGTPLIDALASGAFKVPGRVGFVRLQSSPPPQYLRETNLDGQAGVIGRADRFVRVDDEYEHLVQWLLGDTWFVESLDDAVQFHRSLNVPPRLVTRAGEVLERDGRLIVGPHAIELGLIPRRAELNSLREQTERMAKELEASTRQLEAAEAERDKLKKSLEEQCKQHDSVAQDSARLRLKSEAAADRRDELQSDFDSLAAEEATAKAESLTATGLLTAAKSEWGSIQQIVTQLSAALSGDQGRLETLAAIRTEKESEVTTAKVALAKSEQRLDALQARCEQLQRDQDEREQALEQAASQTKRARERRSDSELAVLKMTSEISELHLQYEQHREDAKQLIVVRDQLRQRKFEHSQHLNKLRERLRAVEQQNHEREMEAERIRHERGVLADRLNEDYGIGVEQLNLQVGSDEQTERESVDDEISELRRKITNIGSVNMDALEELEDLESRYTSLSTQYQDLIDAKEALERIIQKINADSRRLFSETLEAIRENFKVLFRKVFGGGYADIVLEEDVDILESGIDIIATPPGKNSLGLSLLSGGERALTAVALLMAIFEYRPSPFCVLDEVDAPLDDSNIGRFAEVLREFLDWTKFVVVTHNKETMTAANTLYGITMQESGVSKRVSVRFEDVNEKGEISKAAVDRAG